jgi:hypothetical protein
LIVGTIFGHEALGEPLEDRPAAPQGSRPARPARRLSALTDAGLARRFDGQALKAFCERQRSRGGRKSAAPRKLGPFWGRGPPCHTGAMGRREKSFLAPAALPGPEPDDLYDYAKPAVRRLGRPTRTVDSDWTVTDDWPEAVPVSEAEIEVFEAWFGDLFDALFSTRC